VVDEGRTRPIIALSFLQCFHAVGWMINYLENLEKSGNSKVVRENGKSLELAS